MSYNEKRLYERKLSHLYVSYESDSHLCKGIVKNISKNGMYIETKEPLPSNAVFNVLITFIRVPWNKNILTLPVKTIRVDKADKTYNGIGVEVLDPPKKYLDIWMHVLCNHINRKYSKSSTSTYHTNQSVVDIILNINTDSIHTNKYIYYLQTLFYIHCVKLLKCQSQTKS